MSTFSEVERTFFRGQMIEALESKSITTDIGLSHGGLQHVSMAWEEYWKDVPNDAQKELHCLHRCWSRYIDSHFDSGNRYAYCRAYYCLLEKALKLAKATPDDATARAALINTARFETYTVTDEGFGGSGAAVSSLRNPNYQLAKLRAPDAIDDVRFLPLVLAGLGRRSTLFYHYRQHSICSNHSVLLYLPADPEERQSAFQTLCALEGMLSARGDARVDERADRITEKVLIPYLRCRLETNAASLKAMELIDIGAGSGALAAAICGRLQGALAGSDTRHWGIRLVDVLPSELNYFWNASRSRGFDHVLSYVEDFRSWFDAPAVSGGGTCIALVSQLFNNQSLFCLKDVAHEYFNIHAAKKNDARRLSAGACLRQGRGNLSQLSISPSPVVIPEGRTFHQISLDPYFRALHFVVEPSLQFKERSGACLPVRSFNPQCLYSFAGKAILPLLLDHCCAVVVYDADLRPVHLKSAGLDSDRFAAVDLTRVLKLRGNHCYVLGKKDDAGLSALGGERIW